MTRPEQLERSLRRFARVEKLLDEARVALEQGSESVDQIVGDLIFEALSWESDLTSDRAYLPLRFGHGPRSQA